MNTPIVLAALLVVLATSVIAVGDVRTEDTTSASGPQERQSYRALRASRMIGHGVRNPEGRNLGQIKDLILDMRTGDMHYAILEFDPGVFSGEKLFAVPTKELRMAADGNDLVLAMRRDQLERASFDNERWSDAMFNHEFVASPDRAHSVVIQPSQMYRSFRASELIGRDINNWAAKEIGEIEDLVIDMNAQKVHYVVSSFDSGLTAPERLFAFPLRAFSFLEGRDELLLDVNKSRLQAMKSFDQTLWARINDPILIADIDRYLVTVAPVVTTVPSTTQADGERAVR